MFRHADTSRASYARVIAALVFGWQVSQDQGKAFASSIDVPFLETSAKAGTFVDTAFLMMAHEIKNKMLSAQSQSSGGGVDTSKGADKKGGCC